MSMGVKSAKTFEEIVERLVALFKLKPRPGERDYEESVEAVPTSQDPPAAQKATNKTKNKEK
jgi:hypothetical protein